MCFKIAKVGSLSLNSLIISGLIGSIIAAGFFYILWLVSQGRWIGFGDVKFGFLLGLFFGFPMVIISLFLGFLIGTAVSIPLLVLNKKGLKSQLPLGTFLALAAFVTAIFGPVMLRWYLKLIGWDF